MSELCPHLKLHSDEAFKALEQRATAAEQQLAQRWIPVSERVPDGFYTVLVWLDENCDFGYWNNSKQGFQLDGSDFITGGINYWMELPEPPEPQPATGTGRAAGDED